MAPLPPPTRRRLATAPLPVLCAALALLLLPCCLAILTPEQQAKLPNLRNKLARDDQYVKEDLQYIRCGTCQSMVRQTLGVFGEMQKAARANGTKPDEGELLDVLEGLCNTDTHGIWIRWIDLVERGDELTLVNLNKGPGACGTECRTIAKACQDILDSIDVVEFGEKLWSGLEFEPLAKELCREMSGVCLKPDPPTPKDRVWGPAWEDDELPEWYVKQKAEEEAAAKQKAKEEAKANKAKAKTEL